MSHPIHSNPSTRRGSARRRSAALLVVLVGLLLPAAAFAIDPVYSNWRGLAIKGADPVAYFTVGGYRAGRAEHSLEYMGATWRFSSAENKALFEGDPERYAPQYGGYCAWAVSQGYTASVDPEAFAIVDDKLYLNYSQSIQKKWAAEQDAHIAQADANWPGLRDG